MTQTDKTNEEKLAQLIQIFDRAYPSRYQMMWDSFLRGIFMGLGTTLGVSLVLALLTFFISQLKLVPILDNIIIQTHVEQLLPGEQ